ncbi:MAG TPA: serine/threonine-protein kinase [Thermoanaerobaculia bacterium]
MANDEYSARSDREGDERGEPAGSRWRDDPSSSTYTGFTAPPLPRPLLKNPLELKGKRLGPYEIRELLGKGGIGLVFLAYDHRLTRPVALKLLRTDDPEAAGRLLGEARAQARVDHENVCRVYEAGEIEGHAFIAMQHVEGRPLTEAFRAMSLTEKVRTIRRVAEGLQAAHERNLIHRDVKPGNVLVERTSRGEWKPTILDFGLAREQAAPGETTTGEVKGTPSYMAPEQIQGKVHSLDPRTDVYSLGATFYEGLAGRTLFPETTGGLAVMLKVLSEDPEPLRAVDRSVPVDLESIVMRCLEKDPARRYPSAQALAEDLQRFLDGDPVAARPIGPLRRLWRRLRQRRVALLTAGLVATVAVSAALLVYSQLHAGRKTKLMDEYRRDARYVDELMADAYRAPLHDVTGAKHEARARLAEVARRLESQGKLARGPGNFALGRGYLALHEYARAHHHLELAWEHGTRDGEVAYALGRTLGALYEQELTAARRLQDDQQRADRLREIARVYREPALAYLRSSRGVEVDSIEHVEALMAFWEGHHDDALDKAAMAYREVPWLYEALALQGDVRVAIGMALYQRGDYEAALGAYRRAQEVYAAAAEKGRSDARIYEGQCNLGRELMVLASYGLLTSPEPHFEYGLAACARARRVDPERAQPHLLESILYWRLGEHETYAGVDPTVHLESADAAASRALEMAPDDLEIHASLGWARSLLAQWQAGHGADPRPAAARALAVFADAVEIDADFAQGYNGLGYTRYHLAQWETERGLDPSANLAAALEALDRAVALEPEYLYGYDSLGSAWAARAEWEMMRGVDPAASVEEAVRVFARIRELNPRYIWSYVGAGDAWSYVTRDRLSRGEDPSASLERARAAYAEALAVGGEEGWTRLGLGRVATLEGRWQAMRGEDPSASFRLARGEIDRGLAQVSGDKWALQQAIELERDEARWRLGRGLSAAAAIERGLGLVARARALDPGLPAIDALEGTLLVLRGGPDDLAAGRAALKRALAANVHLRREFASALERTPGP